MQVFNQSFVVTSILEDQKLIVTNYITGQESVCSDSVAKVFFSLCQRWHLISVYFALYLVTAEALQGGPDCAGHQRCLTAATSTNW